MKDPCLSLLSDRSTPLPWCRLSAAELFMRRHIQSNLLLAIDTLTPLWTYLNDFRLANDRFKQKQKSDFDTHHGAKPPPEIPKDSEVWLTNDENRTTGRILGPADSPRSYLVEIQSGQIRYNQAHLTVRPDSPTSKTPALIGSAMDATRSPIQTRTHTGTPIIPKRL